VSPYIPSGLGWQPDLPDSRDYTPAHPDVQELLKALRPRPKRRRVPRAVDLRCNGDDQPVYLPAADDQGSLNACCAFACLGLIEYFERRAGRTFEGSKLYLYQMTRGLLRLEGNAPVNLRTTFKALVRFGCPPTEFWPYLPDRLETPPSDPLLSGYSREFQNVVYVRLDPPNATGKETLGTVRSFLAAGFPVAFGFPVPRSLTTAPDVPYRPTFDSYRGGQAAVAVGYNDNHYGGPRGALLIRSSWGTTWGNEGCGWLPYAFVEKQVARDFWTVLRADWLGSELRQP
jgi:C1A family cysteine protease